MFNQPWHLCVFVVAMVPVIWIGCRAPANSNDPETIDINPDEIEAYDAGPEEDAGASCPNDSPDLFNNADSPYSGGDESVDLEVVYFSLFTCSHCADWAAFHQALFKRRADFQKRVRMYFHHNSYDSILHLSSVAAHNQGMVHFWGMHDYIYDKLRNQSGFPSQEDMIGFARDELKLDMDRFVSDLEAEKTIAFLNWDVNQGINAGVLGTPAVFVCGENVVWKDIESTIDKYLR